MSQAQLLSSPVSLPQIVYKGQPVITTEVLARVYECTPQQIRQNFANNKKRFIEGKHYFTLTGTDLKDFRHYIEIFDIVIPARTKHFTLYTEYGSLYHAKSIGTEKAWSVYEVLVETFFRVAHPKPHPLPLPTEVLPTADPDSRLSKRTDPERKALTALVNTWVGMAPIHYASARVQVNAHFGVASVDDLTVAQVKEALKWVQDKIDGLQKALPASEPRALLESHLIRIRLLAREIADEEAGVYEIIRSSQDFFLQSELSALFFSMDRVLENALLALNYNIEVVESHTKNMMTLSRL